LLAKEPDPDPLVKGTDPDPHPVSYQNVTDPEHWFPDPLPHAGFFASFNFHISFFVYATRRFLQLLDFHTLFQLMVQLPLRSDTDLIRISLSYGENKNSPRFLALTIRKKRETAAENCRKVDTYTAYGVILIFFNTLF
jgi:hypothetical protein